MSEYLLEHLWYFVVGICMAAYTVLDGFDLGVGVLNAFVKKDEERRVLLNAIGPVWDGNEVWLVVLIGGLFAGFPDVYASLLSGFYILSMLLLVFLIFRAVAIEFRSKRSSKVWRSTWDYVFALASFGIAFGTGVVLGNLIQGVPIDEAKTFAGIPSLVFRPYPILVGLTSVALFVMHATIFLVMKTEGDLHDKLRRWSQRSMLIFFIMYFLTTCATLIYMPFMAERMREHPWLFILPALAFILFGLVPGLFFKGRDGTAFLLSCFGIASLIGLFGVGTYPVLVRSSIDPIVHSLTLFNSASSFLTLKVLLIVVLIGIPMVLGYGVYIYRTFRGKVKVGPTSY
jgi:cytochrome bd ubiquinol oxidase subunit II